MISWYRYQFQIFSLFRASVGYPTILNLEKKPRESTDLEEYDFIVPKNFF